MLSKRRSMRSVALASVVGVVLLGANVMGQAPAGKAVRVYASLPQEQRINVYRLASDDGALALIESFLKAGILDGLKEWTPEAGAPQGAVLSPLLSNIYLTRLDHLMAQSGYEMVRYADDFVILCRTAEAASRALELVKQWTIDNGLTLHPTKTRIVDSRSEIFGFLGYDFRWVKHWPRKKSVQKLKDTIREKTKRANGNSLHCVVTNVNSTLRGWFSYFQHGSYRSDFTKLDKWIRMRLRSILRRRRGLTGRSRGYDHNRWPNAFFAKIGLFSLTSAHIQACQSSRR